MMLAALVLVWCLATSGVAHAAAAAAGTQYFSTTVEQGGAFHVSVLSTVPSDMPWGPNEAVRTSYTPSYLQDGWDRLNIATNPAMDDLVAAQAAGYTEGKLTAGSIYNHAVNTGVYGTKLNKNLTDFINTNQAFMLDKIKAAKSLDPSSDEAIYWRHVDIVNAQLLGVCEGYHSTATGADHPMPCLDFLRLNLDGDMEDLEGVYGEQPRTREEMALSASHCSALIKLLPGNTDLYIAQDTWSSFNSMTRIMKRYDFPFTTGGQGHSRVPGSAVAFSSYPGVLFSGDDFYLINSGLAVMETTIGNSNPALNKYIVPQTVLEWLRNIVANRLAHDGPSWDKVYRKYNSGTYNNQNFVLNYNLFTPGKKLQPNTLYMVEQIPGTVVATDVTSKLQEDLYFGSYNTAYDPEIRKLSGADENVELYGSWFTYNMTARARIFRRNHTHVVDMPTMQALMRYNNYKHDPLSSQMDTCHYRGMSNCTPPYTTENTIACRGDLNPKDGVWGLSAFGLRNHVATDSKISSFSTFNATSLPIRAVSGPPSDQVPVFQWSTSPFSDTPHHGMPDAWTFPWVTIGWSTPLSP
ncbi:hypothetical protein PTSG_12806 [Salpingoeca rosetta]|uniref:Phospholipase B-like n=1 Tax=Salpingoeca rosetta (strain ATCC 50818 / BSB-021) TaxID=946362 RepID=F2UKX6_SALR5|nr:uncharacterized protein PTSG_12806 [Salpingoeca rosetta]EGD77775.1 hypothetical protein PTSG_12806 [Salpingoeca rosetta]|eukprot:XP_004990251.1 hypothetical protein PTSG_12806 [Salpingoeca rosetta]